MSLELYFHPLASFCWKVLIALYENHTPFTPHFVDLADESARNELERLWPVGKFPVLRDGARAIPESSIIIEYLDWHHPGPVKLVPPDPDLAREARLWDRFFDLYVQAPMQKMVTDKLRPPASHDRHGVQEAGTMLATAYRMLDHQLADKTWSLGDAFSIADCAAAPALYYANRVAPLGDEHGTVASYLARLLSRPSMARVLREAEPYLRMFPG
jgi:glutathione S-transferase